MRDEYDFSVPEARPNPHARRLKQQITIRLGHDVLEYFKEHAAEIDMPYQNLIDMYLRDCVIHKRRLNFSWDDPA